MKKLFTRVVLVTFITTLSLSAMDQYKQSFTPTVTLISSDRVPFYVPKKVINFFNLGQNKHDNIYQVSIDKKNLQRCIQIMEIIYQDKKNKQYVNNPNENYQTTKKVKEYIQKEISKNKHKKMPQLIKALFSLNFVNHANRHSHDVNNIHAVTLIVFNNVIDMFLSKLKRNNNKNIPSSIKKNFSNISLQERVLNIYKLNLG